MHLGTTLARLGQASQIQQLTSDDCTHYPLPITHSPLLSTPSKILCTLIDFSILPFKVLAEISGENDKSKRCTLIDYSALQSYVSNHSVISRIKPTLCCLLLCGAAVCSCVHRYHPSHHEGGVTAGTTTSHLSSPRLRSRVVSKLLIEWFA